MQAQAMVVEKPFAAAEEKLSELVERLSSKASREMTHGDLERVITTEGREIQRRLLQGHLDLRAASERVVQGFCGADGAERSHHRPRTRNLMTVFGLVTCLRIAYGARGRASLKPADASLNLPKELHSHGLRQIAAVEAARGSFDATVEAIERNTAAKVAKRQVEDLVKESAQDFDAFYKRADLVDDAACSTDLLVLSLDGKGIVMRQDGLREATRKAAQSDEHKLDQRPSKGEKSNRKRMATVAAVYDLEPYTRRPEDILTDLRPLKEAGKPRPRARNKRVWASVEKDAQDVTCDVFEEAERRDPQHRRAWVVLVDGDRHQISRVRAEAKRRRIKVTIVCDFIHVLEYIWDAAWCLFERDDKQAEQWVRARALAVLQGRCGYVAAGIRRSATLRNLDSKKRKGIDDCANYLLAKRKMLRYDLYLREGLPIATGVIEGACRHLICDRMDITGARWGLKGAEAVLRLRSLRSSGDFDDYWRFHLALEHQRNHGSPHTVTPPTPRSQPVFHLIRGGIPSS